MNFVKEQRVNGNRWIKPIHLRYTLMGFERNYQVKILSKQLNLQKLSFSTLNNKSKLNPWFISGFVDGEGSFFTTIYKNNNYKKSWYLKINFAIGLGKNDLSLLLQIQEFFGGIGSIIINQNQNMVIYSVGKIEDLTNIIIPFFEKYLLLTQKAADFILFKQILELMKNKEHLSIEGLQKIINIKASMNSGLSDVLKSNFKKIIPVERPLILTENITDPNWLAGFVCGEGKFEVRISQSKSVKIGYYVILRFRIYQHERNIKLMELLVKYLGGGKLEKQTNQKVVNLLINKISDITNIIIPFFEVHPLNGVKQLDFLDWCKIANLMNKGSHLTIEGLDLIRKIKSNINKGRK